VIQQGSNFNEYRAYRELAAAGESTVRAQAEIWMMFWDFIPLEEIEKEIRQLSFITPKGIGDEWFKVCGIKTLYDGSTSMYDFDDLRHFSKERLKAVTEIIAKYQMRVSMHTIGDRAIDHFLDACDSIQGKYPIDKLRWYSVHHCFPNPDDYPRIKKLGLVVNAQPLFIHIGENKRYIEKDPRSPRLESMSHPFKSELEAGIKVGFGSDCTVVTYDPFVGMQIAVTRKAPQGPNKGWIVNESEKIPRRQALACYTINTAYLMFEEDIKGSIEPGKLADMVVIDKDIMTVPEDEIRKINVEMTIVGGTVVYQHESGTEYPEHPYWSWM